MQEETINNRENTNNVENTLHPVYKRSETYEVHKTPTSFLIWIKVIKYYRPDSIEANIKREIYCGDLRKERRLWQENTNVVNSLPEGAGDQWRGAGLGPFGNGWSL